MEIKPYKYAEIVSTGEIACLYGNVYVLDDTNIHLRFKATETGFKIINSKKTPSKYRESELIPKTFEEWADKNSYIRVDEAHMASQIAMDHKANILNKTVKKKRDFMVNGELKVSEVKSNAIIIDKQGREHPYYIDKYRRNGEQLLDFKYIYWVEVKTLREIIIETQATVRKEYCKFYDGGGWYTRGVRFYYRKMYCELKSIKKF